MEKFPRLCQLFFGRVDSLAPLFERIFAFLYASSIVLALTPNLLANSAGLRR